MKTKAYKASSWQMMCLEIALEKMLANANPASTHIENTKALLSMVQDSVGITFRHEVK